MQRQHESFGSALNRTHRLVQLSILKGFLQNRPDTMSGQTTRGLERKFRVKRKQDKTGCAQENSINPYAEKKLRTTLYKKLKSTATL